MEQKIILDRQEALHWWRNLLNDQLRRHLASKYKDNWDFVMVDTSSSAIECIYKKYMDALISNTAQKPTI